MPLRSAHEAVQNGEALAAYPGNSRQFRSISQEEVIHFEKTCIRQSPGSANPYGSRIAALTVEVEDATGSYHATWAGEGLEKYAVLQPVWAPVAATG